jgi:hypothetical protein
MHMVAVFAPFALVAALGIATSAYSRRVARFVAAAIARAPRPVQQFYGATNLGHSYDSDFWATYYRYAGAALAVLALAVFLIVLRQL